MNSIVKSLLISTFFALGLVAEAQDKIPSLNEKLGTAWVKTRGNRLTVSTGKMERTWQWTGEGLVSVEIRNSDTRKEWKAIPKEIKSDWAYYNLIDGTPGKLINLSAEKSNDEGFTSDFLKVTAEVQYSSVESAVKYEIWAYPNATGIRTQLFIKGNAKNYLRQANVAQTEAAIGYKLVDGTIITSKAPGVKNMAVQTNTVHMVVSNLKPAKKYVLGISFSSADTAPLKQRIRATSIDKEIDVTLLAEADAWQTNKSFQIELPAKLLTDGSFRLFADKLQGAQAAVSEIWIYEKGNKKDQIISGDKTRINELSKQAPEDSFLAGYYNFEKPVNNQKQSQYGRTDFLPVSPRGMTRRLIGYYNDTQNRNTRQTPLKKEETFTVAFQRPEQYDWANIVCLEDAKDGVMLVKESHKCVNQYGVETGDFEVNSYGIANRGTALLPADINPDTYQWCWATWSIVYGAGEENRQTALKKFDRLRYPVDPVRDIYIQANTWGSSRNQLAAAESNILVEIDKQAELGIDVQQIDDGWQDKNWHPKVETYPNGWTKVMNKAKEKNIKLGLWGAAIPITLDQLKYNYNTGQFISYKLDFASLNNHQKIDALINKVRNFINYTGHKVRVNWDVTENAPRFGYFWAREYGCVYLENRKPDVPKSVIYVPYLVLRDIWHLSKYANINRFQTTIQNIDKIDPKASDAYKHSHSYAIAIGLIGTPLFFQETHFYTPEAIAEIKPILAVYKSQREEIYKNYTFPIGKEPDNQSWSGFQNCAPKGKSGYLFIFREIENQQKQESLNLEFIKNKQLLLTNLISGEKLKVHVGKDGSLDFTIDKPADFRFFKYEVQ